MRSFKGRKGTQNLPKLTTHKVRSRNFRNIEQKLIRFTVYADKAEAKAYPALQQSNCTHRAHQNTLESMLTISVTYAASLLVSEYVIGHRTIIAALRTWV